MKYKNMLTIIDLETKLLRVANIGALLSIGASISAEGINDILVFG